MTFFPDISKLMPLDFATFNAETIFLDAHQIDQAVELSLKLPTVESQWQTYLHALALFAFETWLDDRLDSIILNQENCSLFQLPVANLLPAVCHLHVNQFKLCLLATGSLSDDQVSCPRAILELPEYIPHFYIVIEVLEEQESAKILGFLRYDQLISWQKQVDLEAQKDWTYPLPMAWFDSDLDHLLLDLQCLEPAAIFLPAIPYQTPINLSQFQEELSQLLSQHSSYSSQVWQILSWEQAQIFFTRCELLNWVYQIQKQFQNNSEPSQTYLSDLFTIMTQPALNLCRWFSHEFDLFSQTISLAGDDAALWVLLPTLAPSALRSTTEEFKTLIQELQQQVKIPPQARGGYQDLQLAEYSFRLYAIVWPVQSQTIPEWTLLLMLGSTSFPYFPADLMLRISDQTGILIEQNLSKENQDSYFFTSVIGTWEEIFLVTLSLNSKIELTLPPFCFHPEDKQ